MIDRRDNPHDLFFEAKVPFESDTKRVKKFEHELNKILNKYEMHPVTDNILYQLKTDLEVFLHKEENKGVLIIGSGFYEPKIWSVNYLFNQYAKHYPERFEDKKQYTNMEINNMLFDLNLKGIIGNYHSPAVCYDLPFHNNKIFTDETIRVEEPAFVLGDVEEYKIQKFLNKLNDADLKLEVDL